MGQQAFHPGGGVEKLQVRTAEPEPLDPAELKVRIAATVRAESARGLPTQEQTIQALADGLPREAWGAQLAEMAAEERYADLKAVVAPSGRIYLFSQDGLPAEQASERCLAEEAKVAIAERIRQNSRAVVLTSAADLEDLFPWPEPERRAALLGELQRDPRFGDIQQLAGPDAQACYLSDLHLSTNYARIMMRARARDAGASIAEFVRDRSRTMPAPTKLTVFDDQVFGLTAEELRAFVGSLAAPAEPFADIRSLVHPATGATYLYSSRWLDEETAGRLMDWEEVGLAQNP